MLNTDQNIINVVFACPASLGQARSEATKQSRFVDVQNRFEIAAVIPQLRDSLAMTIERGLGYQPPPWREVSRSDRGCDSPIFSITSVSEWSHPSPGGSRTLPSRGEEYGVIYSSAVAPTARKNESSREIIND
ncbi:MAG: hypothetical protein IIB39_09730 [Candidatus Marinimicrobia bacterium]|nr:hypothetical protein [Candidatus Neomarinimicrobiota bacterium]